MRNIPQSIRAGWRALALGLGLAVAALVAATPDAIAGGTISGLAPAKPQPNPAALEPGLAVTYYYGLVLHVDKLAKKIAKNSKGHVGPPIPQLNYKVGQGAVLTSRFKNGVGAYIEGLINFPEAGTYVLKMQSNDGVKLEIGGKLIHLDPGVHANTFSDPIPVKIDAAGWYPLSLIYFEHKNTATLELYWSKPGGAEAADFVPADAFAHVPK
jgi:hypothetical protein